MAANHQGRSVEAPEGRRAALVVAGLSLLLGLLSVFLLLKFVAGIPALLLGLLSLRRLNASERVGEAPTPGLTLGRRLAVGGMLLGLAGCLLGVGGILALLLTDAAEKSRRLACTNNLRQIGKGIGLYHTFNEKTYPPATTHRPQGLAGFAPWRDPPYERQLSWLVGLLPYLEQPETAAKEKLRRLRETRYSRLWQRFDPSQAWDAPANEEGINTPIRMLLCSSHPQFDVEHEPALGHYVGITGVGADAAELPLGAERAGFFGYERRLRTGHDRPDVIPAGTSQTLLAAETALDNGPWAAAGRATLRPLIPSEAPYLGPGRPFGGLHPGGANALMVDGSVRFFTNEVSPEILERHATLADD